jgi:hypothetical protein
VGRFGLGDALDEHFAALRAALAAEASVSLWTDHPRPPRDTKQARVLAMLRRDEGATRPQIAEAMGWALHTVRGFLASLGKKSISIDVLKRVRQLGPNKADVKGGYIVSHGRCAAAMNVAALYLST